MPAVALTDHGSLAGAVELYRHADRAGVKPIVGCEVYVTDDRRTQTKGYAHLTLLAESNEGYANLIRLSSIGYLEGYYYKPRVDWELLSAHAKGIDRALGLPVRAGLQGARAGPDERTRRPSSRGSCDIFGRDSVYVELQDAGLPVQQEINPQLVALSRVERHPARHHRRRPLPPPRGRAGARGAALHPVGRHAGEPESLEVRHRPVLLQDAGGDAGDVRPSPRGDGADARDRGSVHGHDGARADPAPPTFPTPDGARRLRVPRRALRRGNPAALRARHARAATIVSPSS